MNFEHDEIMEQKLEKISERLEELVTDTIMAVLERLKEQNKVVLKSRAEARIPF